MNHQRPHRSHPRQHSIHQQIAVRKKPRSDSPDQDSDNGGGFVFADCSLDVIPEAFERSPRHCSC